MTVRQTRKEGGVVLLLILGFMAMFAVMVVTFIMMTTNMSESANSDVTSGGTAEQTAAADANPAADARGALRTLMIGTNDHASPIGPFSIGENLYGEISPANNDPFVFENGVDYLGNPALVTIDPSTAQLTIHLESERSAVDNEALARSLVYETGSVLTFGIIGAGGYHSDFWNQHVQGTSALICEKSMAPVVDTGYYTVTYALLPSAELKQFMAQFNADELRDYNYPAFGLRINPPAFSGTGAGGFTVNNRGDGEAGVDTTHLYDNDFRLPFALWGNAAAPDKVVYNAASQEGTRILDARTFYKHLSDSTYTPLAKSGGGSYPSYLSGSQGWDLGPDEEYSGFSTAPVRMNPSYTAPDVRTLFLAHFGGETGNDVPAADSNVPSFLRPLLLQELVGEIDYAISSKTSEEGAVNQTVDWQSVIRKLSPRPLPLDHWHFTAGQTPELDELFSGTVADGYDRLTHDDREEGDTVRYDATTDAVRNLALRLGAADADHPGQRGTWDVDNDGDGTKESIWIPSGLPIRSASDGTPYATFYSFLVLDMDGRVNVNTAGNWDQIPYFTTTDGFYQPFDILEHLSTLYNNTSNDVREGSFSPWRDVTAPDAWLNDRGENLLNLGGKVYRGEGFGPTEINLLHALDSILTDNRAIPVSSNILWNRALSAGETAIGNVIGTMICVDHGESAWSDTTRKTLSQPGSYRYPQDASSQEMSNRDSHELVWNFTDPLYRGDLNENSNADPMNFDFPWRGKTHITRYDRYARFYPTFDYNGSSLRVYDPLGNDFLTTAPRMSENPYLLYPNQAGTDDTPYGAASLETLLRMYDGDAKSGDTSLVDELARFVSTDLSELNNYGIREYFNHPGTFEDARQTLTTFSSDIPLPAQIFPIGPARYGDGDFGLYQLIRRCVIMELYRDILGNSSGSEEGGESTTRDGAVRKAFAEADAVCYRAVMSMYYGDGESPSEEEIPEEVTDKINQLKMSLRIAILYDNLSSVDLNSVVYDGDNRTLQDFLDQTLGNGGRGFYFDAVNQVTDDLYALLPEDIRAGRRLDLNALSREASYLGWKYDANNLPAVMLPDGDEQAREIHNHGLVERMKFARGLYVLLSALTWQERNAALVADFFLGEDTEVLDRISEEVQFGDYFEESFADFLKTIADPASNPSNEKQDERRAMEQEIFANRLAQWCVNVVDFSDPDATMTPFYFDPTPLDGWWEKILLDPPNARDVVEETFLHSDRAFSDLDYSCPYPDVYDAFEAIFADPDCVVPAVDVDSAASDFRRILGETDGVSIYETGKSYAKQIANWLEGIIPNESNVLEEHDFGFRRVWGMERPDLLLTETLNFHDLGIADTQAESINKDGHGNYTNTGEDPDFDQVRRPQGSSYLELYCAANPNIPQSPELYEFDSDLNLWKLDLSRMTPRVDGLDSPYQDLAFPVWRIAISASRDPHNSAKDEEGTGDKGRERKIRKKENSILERLKGEDASLFSFQPRQFNGQFVTESGAKNYYGSDETDEGGAVVHSLWRDLDICASNILGAALVDEVNVDGKAKRSLSNEIEIDRVVWMTRPMDSTGHNWEQVSKYPDATRLFWRVFEPGYEVAADVDHLSPKQTRAYLFPNQYFVIGPEDERSIGSYRRSETIHSEDIDIQPPATVRGYFGVPSPVKIVLNDTHRTDGVVDEMTPVLNPYNRVVERRDQIDRNTHFDYHEVQGSMRVATYYGIATGAQTISYKRGLNISEPLWTAQTDSTAAASGLSYDPYRDTMYHKQIPIQTVTFEGKSVEATKEFVEGMIETTVPDIPFDTPAAWIDSSRRSSNSSLTKLSPIAEDEIFGLGTIPGIRSAFLQRVADPNLPYHPLLNPYLTVDWNMMDLTVMNGEIADAGVKNTDTFFFASTEEKGVPEGVELSDYIDTENKLVAGNDQTDVFTEVGQKYSESTANDMIFSSRQWGNAKQAMFFPMSTVANCPPNPWARAVNLQKKDTFGLQTAVGSNGSADDVNEKLGKYNRSSKAFNYVSNVASLVLPFAPKHTLGWYNNRGILTSEAAPIQLTTAFNWYDGLETDWVSRLNLSNWEATFSPYIGSPRRGSTSGAVQRMEYLAWNDAPMTNPLELALVPASSPARFGTEFVRAKEDGQFKLSWLASAAVSGGRSLGSGTKADSLFGYDPSSDPSSASDTAVCSPYLNFFSSVDESFDRDEEGNWVTALGRSLNLAKIFEFVTVPSPVNGTRAVRTQWNGERFEQLYFCYPSGGSSLYDRALTLPTLREPGKINLNTIAARGSKSPVWNALAGDTERFPWDSFKTGRINENTGHVVPFQSPLSAPLDPAPLSGILSPDGTSDDEEVVTAVPADASLFARKLNSASTSTDESGTTPGDSGHEGSGIGNPLWESDSVGSGNLRAAMAEMSRLSGLTTNRSNVFAVWLTVGYFKVERVNPGVNMPQFDPDGNRLEGHADGKVTVDVDGETLSIFDDHYKYGPYYRAIYPDGYTYAEELGTSDSVSGLQGTETGRTRAFYLIDRSIPFDFRRGRSINWEKAILLEKML